MKSVTVIGAGMGPDTMTAEGIKALDAAEFVFGAQRLLDGLLKGRNVQKAAYYTAEEINPAIFKSGKERFAVLVSGDTGFYSAAAKLAKELRDCDVRVLPGISSLSYMFSKIDLPWQDAAFISCHGRSANIADTVRRNRLTFALTGANVSELASALCAADFGDLKIWVGENLGGDNERLFCASARELEDSGVPSLAVMVIENPGFDSRIRSGIPDSEFIRDSVPMTKAETRAVSLAKLGLRDTDICYDIGAGTGSVTVEMSLAAHKGRVYAVERNPEGVELIRKNLKAFHIGNAAVIEGSAPEALADLPAPDAVFIGGSGGSMEAVIAAVKAKNERARIVVNAIAIESAHSAIAALEKYGYLSETVHIGVSTGKKAGGINMLIANNPIFIITGETAHE